MIDRNGFGATAQAEPAATIDTMLPEDGDQPTDAALEAPLAGLSSHGDGAKGPPPGELRWRLTTLIFPALLLVFVAFYVTRLAAGTEPEIALFQAGGASLVLAVLARVAVGILGDETRLVLNDSQIVAMARNGAVRDYLASSGTERGAALDSDGNSQPTTAAQTAGTGGKE